jgi:hypothetical protein
MLTPPLIPPPSLPSLLLLPRTSWTTPALSSLHLPPRPNVALSPTASACVHTCTSSYYRISPLTFFAGSRRRARVVEGRPRASLIRLAPRCSTCLLRHRFSLRLQDSASISNQTPLQSCPKVATSPSLRLFPASPPPPPPPSSHSSSNSSFPCRTIRHRFCQPCR